MICSLVVHIKYPYICVSLYILCTHVQIVLSIVQEDTVKMVTNHRKQPRQHTLLTTKALLDNVQEHVEAGLGGRPEVGVRSLLQLADEEPQAHLTVETQEAARLAFNPAQEYREGMLIFRLTSLCTLLPHVCSLRGGGGGEGWLGVAKS